MCSCLFIDEAYSLFYKDDGKDFGKEAISELIKCMEEYRGQFAVIFAGYKNETREMIQSNPGLESRINKYIDFPNYNHEELKEIAIKMMFKAGYVCDGNVLEKLVSVVEAKKDDPNFGNARDIRNILESLYEIQAARTIDEPDNKEVLGIDLEEYIKENNISNIEKKCAELGETKQSLTDLYSNSRKVSKIDCSYIDERTVLIKKKQNGQVVGEGTGFFINESGLIVTNNHVIDEADEIIIRQSLLLNNGLKTYKEYKASICKANKDKDVAIIKIDELDIKTPYLMMSTYLPKELTPVIMGGYPYGASRLNSISFSEGLVQSINKDSYINDIDKIYLDIHGVPGNSGSAVIDKTSGEVVGIYSGASISRRDGITSEMNYAMLINYAWELIE